MAIVLRYVDSKGMLHEHFLTYIEAASLTAESLTKYILDTLHKFHLDPNWIISQGYDGASVMSGQCSGVQQRIRNVAPNALYVHCYAHTLNLVLVDSVKMVPYATEFSPCWKLCMFLYQLPKPMLFSCRNSKNSTLTNSLYNCKSFVILDGHGSVNATCRTYDSLLTTLEDIGDGSDHIKAIEAKGLYYQVANFSFIVSLVMFDRILSCTKCLSDQLQSTQVDLAQAADLVLATKSTLEEYCADTFWEKNLYLFSENS